MNGVEWTEAENSHERPMQSVPQLTGTLHAETVLSHLEQSLAFARAHLTQAEADFQAFKRMTMGH